MSTESVPSSDTPKRSDALTQKDREVVESLLDVMRRLDARDAQRGALPSELAPPYSYTAEEKAMMAQLCEGLEHMIQRKAELIASGISEAELMGTEGALFGDMEGTLPGLGLPAEIAGVEENGDQDMGLFDKHRICICSEVEGVISKDGQPLAGVEVVRRLDLFLPKDRVYTDTTITDEKGCFSFPPAYAKKWKHRLGEVRTDQKILVRHEGQTYLGWINITSGRELHEDIRETFSPREEFYFRLQFYGDLARATPLSESAEEQRFVPKELCFFNTQTVCVASWLRFTVTMNGEPAVGAKVTRTAELVGIGGFEQSKKTDGDGEIELPAIYTPRLVHRDAKIEIHQRIVITYQGKDYLAWEKTKTNFWESGEFNIHRERPLFDVEITAELTADQTATRGVKTDANRCWKGTSGGDYLPDDALPYRGLFQVTRFDPNMESGQEE